MNIKFAFAVTNDGFFPKTHFGDSEKYLIYQLAKNKINFEQEISNSFIDLDEGIQHGSKKKGQAIIALLKENDIDVLVSRQFGKNIKLINKHFLPVIVFDETPDSMIKILLNHIQLIQDELIKDMAEYPLFAIKHGIMKSAIKKLDK